MPRALFSTFVGRERELSELELGLEDARAGHGGLYLLVGEPGIGKTRLADQIAEHARSKGYEVCWGRCWEVGGAPAYWPWIQVLRALGRGSQKGSDELAEALSKLAPAEESTSPKSDAAHERFRVFDAVTAALCHAAARQPLMLVLDDLHAADPSSLALLSFMTRALSSSHLYALGTYRDQESRRGPDRGETLARVAREATYLPLRRFGTDEVKAVLLRHGTEADEETLRQVVATTEGHPLFVEEVCRLLTLRDRSRGSRGIPVPRTVRDAIRERLVALTPSARTALEAAAVLGRELASRTLAGLLELGATQVDAVVDEALTLGVLVEAESDVYAFSHALVRDGLYREIPEQKRAELHARAAEILTLEGAPEAALGEVASHLLEAVSVVGPERALDGAMRAAERAMRAYAFEDASAILDRALNELRAKLSDARAQAEALLLLGEARVRARTDGTEACLRAAELARQLDDPELFARAGLALGAEIQPAISNQVLIALLEEALTRLPTPASALRARVLARLAGALQPALDPRGPIELAREAIAMAKALGDELTLRRVLLGAGSALVDYADARERLAVDGETLALARAAGDAPLGFRANLRLFFDHAELGDLLAEEACHRECARACDELRRPQYRFYRALLAAVLAIQRADFATADALESEAHALLREVEDPALTLTFAQHRLGKAILRHDATTLAAVVPQLVEAVAHVSQKEWIDATQGLLHARAGRHELARECRGRIPDEFVRFEPPAMQLVTEMVVLSGSLDGAERLLEHVEARRGRWVSWGIAGAAAFGPFVWLSARLEALLGRWDEAERDFAEAIAACEANGARAALAHVLFDYGMALAGRGDDRARALLDRVEALAREHDMPGLLERVRAIPTAPGAPRPARLPTSLYFELTQEGDVWKIVRDGRAFHLKDTRGLRMLAKLLAEPGREHHALTLGASGDPGDLGDSGEILDAEAIRQYRGKLEELREEEREADEFGDGERADRARRAIDLIARELAEGVGMGGRQRKAGAASERARVNVQRRIRDAIKRVEEHDPELAQYLGWTVKTGAFCVYLPNKAK